MLLNMLRNNGMPGYYDAGMTRPDLVFTTAEDGLLVIPRTTPPRLNIIAALQFLVVTPAV
jgi:hypothetical protein